MMVPALRALKEHWADSELHVLVRSEAVAVLQNIPWIEKVWGIQKGFQNGALRHSINTVIQLRMKNFNRSIDFEGNDRGALLSLLVGARERLGSLSDNGFRGRRCCYTQEILKAPNGLHEVQRDIHTLKAWNVPPPTNTEPEVHSDPTWEPFAKSIFPQKGVALAHLSTSQPKKEWPVDRWAEIATRAIETNVPLFFSSGVSIRERKLLDELRRRVPTANVLPSTPNLASFISVVERAGLFISGDTGPLHIAAGLGVPTVGIFGPSDMNQWLPLSRHCQGLSGSSCVCNGHFSDCQSSTPCILGVTVDEVWAKIQSRYGRQSSR